MSILIKGMEMPECCGYCPFEYKKYCMAKPSLTVESADRHPRCPLVPVPPHGRLINEAALWVEINKICDRRDAGIITDLTCAQQLLSAVRHAPTIIPAEEVE